MKILVVGGTGFIGFHLVKYLLNDGHKLMVTGTNIEKAKKYDWYTQVEFEELNIEKISPIFLKKCKGIDKVIHLAWEGLPNYKQLFHFEKNLPTQYNFIKQLVELGIKDITVTGTCLEYGMKEGGLDVGMITSPQNPYALAKDTLRKFLQELQKQQSFKLKWVRLFYMYGLGQAQHSILAQLDRAVANNESVFNMSEGEQLRDYLPVEQVAKKIIALALDSNFDGIANCCSGKPISIRTLVEHHLKINNQTISLNLGHYPYSDIEPMAFWGVR